MFVVELALRRHRVVFFLFALFHSRQSVSLVSQTAVVHAEIPTTISAVYFHNGSIRFSYKISRILKLLMMVSRIFMCVRVANVAKPEFVPLLDQ